MPAEGYQWREDEFLYGDATSALRAAKEDAEWTALLCGHAVDGAFDDDTANRELAGHFRRLGYETIRFTFADDASAVGGAARADPWARCRLFSRRAARKAATWMW